MTTKMIGLWDFLSIGDGISTTAAYVLKRGDHMRSLVALASVVYL